jgi:hypothetical protein
LLHKSLFEYAVHRFIIYFLFLLVPRSVKIEVIAGVIFVSNLIHHEGIVVEKVNELAQRRYANSIILIPVPSFMSMSMSVRMIFSVLDHGVQQLEHFHALL